MECLWLDCFPNTPPLQLSITPLHAYGKQHSFKGDLEGFTPDHLRRGDRDLRSSDCHSVPGACGSDRAWGHRRSGFGAAVVPAVAAGVSGWDANPYGAASRPAAA